MIRLLTELDVNAALKLSQEAGWNQTEADWRRVLALAPDGCFAIDREGSLAATATVVCYGRALAWIGMVLTRDRFRRLGLARLLVEYALEFSRRRGIPVIGLDASEMGWPLYTSLGFREECAIERWGAGTANSRAVNSVREYSSMPDLDSDAFGYGRARLLSALAVAGGVSAPGLGDPHGYALGRPGLCAAHFGPCAARTPEAARELVAGYLQTYVTGPVVWDLFPANAAAAALAREFGFARQRSLTRMTIGKRAGDNSLVYAAAGFEYG